MGAQFGRSQSALRRREGRQSGFTLVELLVVVLLVVLLLLGLLEVFDSNSSLARRQMEVAEMQQALRAGARRMTRLIRMAGRGGLPAMLESAGGLRLPALEVRDNVGTRGRSRAVVPGLAQGPLAVAGTDILTVRGVLTTSIYQVTRGAGALALRDSAGLPVSDPGAAATGLLRVATPGPTGHPQPLDDLNNAIDMGLSEALILVGSVDPSVYAVVELDPAASTAGENDVTLAFRVAGGTHPEYRDLYLASSGPDPRLPEELTSVAWVGILEEYRFYVRDADAGPTLSMARMLPATEVPHGGNASARLDVAEHIRQLQVALGHDSSLGEAPLDRNGDSRTDQSDILVTETADGGDDDWLFNGASDEPLASPWVPPWDDDETTAIPSRPQIYFVRLSTLGRVPSPLRNFQAPIIPAIENAIMRPLNTREERRHRRQLLQTTIELRNIS